MVVTGSATSVQVGDNDKPQAGVPGRLRAALLRSRRISSRRLFAIYPRFYAAANNDGRSTGSVIPAKAGIQTTLTEHGCDTAGGASPERRIAARKALARHRASSRRWVSASPTIFQTRRPSFWVWMKKRFLPPARRQDANAESLEDAVAKRVDCLAGLEVVDASLCQGSHADTAFSFTKPPPGGCRRGESGAPSRLEPVVG